MQDLKQDKDYGVIYRILMEIYSPLKTMESLLSSISAEDKLKLSDPMKLKFTTLEAASKILNNFIDKALKECDASYNDKALNMEPFSIKDMIEIAFSICSSGSPNEQIPKMIKVPDNLPSVLADSTNILQVFCKLIENALRYTDNKPIIIEAINLGDHVKVSVANQLTGNMDEATKSKIESCLTEKASWDEDFFGLKMIQKILLEHRSKLEVSFDQDKLTFAFALEKGAASEPKAPQQKKSNLLATNNKEDSFVILVVDDEPMNRLVLKKILQKRNYRVYEAEDGVCALEWLEQNPAPSLILLDIMMPRKSGFDILPDIRKKYSASTLPVVLLTAKSDVADIVNGFKLGANDFVRKPFITEELMVRVEAEINVSSMSSMFKRFVPYEFISLLGKQKLNELKLGDQTQIDISVLFCDIRSFTTLSESMEPEENFNFINSYLNHIGPIIRKCNGFIDKYIGDGIMALFPFSADALRAALQLQTGISEFNATRKSSGKPPIKVGTGIHRGSLMLGVIGESSRMESTVISDVVNVASRLEGISKHYQVNTVISEEILRDIPDHNQFIIRYIDCVMVRGTKREYSVFELIDDSSPESKLKQSYQDKYASAIAALNQANHGEAKAIFEEILTQNPGDKVVALHLEKIAEQEKTEKAG